MKRQPKKQCETGIPDEALRVAIREWDAAARVVTRDRVLELASSSPVGYVASMPRYPTSGTDEYTRCIQKWYAAWQEASRLDATIQQMGYLKQQIEAAKNQLGVLQGQVNTGEVALVALTAAFVGCMNGIQT
jgi:hypothetical protein